MKQARIYVVTSATAPTQDQFVSAVEGRGWHPPAKMQAESIGFVPMVKGRVCHEAAGWLFATARRTQRKVAAKALADEVDARIADLEVVRDLDEHPLTRVERREIKGEAKDKLMAMAAPQSDYHLIAYHPDRRLLAIEAGAGAADAVLSTLMVALRERQVSMGLMPARYGADIGNALTAWAEDDLPQGLGWADGCTMKSDRGKATLTDLTPSSEEAKALLHAGAELVKAAVWQKHGEGVIRWAIDEEGAITGIEHYATEADDQDDSDPDAETWARFTVYAGTLDAIIGLLQHELSGPIVEVDEA